MRISSVEQLRMNLGFFLSKTESILAIYMLVLSYEYMSLLVSVPNLSQI